MRARTSSAGVMFRVGALVVIVALIILIPATRSIAKSGFNAVLRTLVMVSNTIRPGSVDRTNEENERLRSANAELLKQVETLKTAVQASASLERIDAFLNSAGRRGIAGAVIAYSDDPSIKTFTISIGEKNGVAVGMAVVSDSGVMIGKVIAVRESTAIVRDIRDTQSTILARVENETRSQGVVRGQRGIGLTMSFIPRDDRLESAMVVTTSGTEALIPPNIPIGTITRFTTQPGDVFQTIDLLSPIKFADITAVAVVFSS